MKSETAVNAVRILDWANIAMTVSACILLVCVAMNLTYPRKALAHRTSLELRVQKAQDRAQAAETVPAAFNEAVFKKKNLFNVPEEKKPAGPAREFVLLGVSLGEHIIAVVRDQATGKVSYCTEGDMIDDYRVRAIGKNCVTLESRRGILEIYQ